MTHQQKKNKAVQMGRSVDQRATGRTKRVRSKINWSKLTSQRLS